MIFGDSQHVIFKLINGYSSGSINCRHLYDKAKPLMTKSYELFHIFRHNNSATDALANMGAPYLKVITVLTETPLTPNSSPNGLPSLLFPPTRKVVFPLFTPGSGFYYP